MWNQFIEIMQTCLFLFSQLYGGNFALGIMTLTLAIRLILLPLTIYLARRALARQAILKELQPKLERLRKRYRGKPEKLAQETIRLYRSHHFSLLDGYAIFGGLLQFPFFIGIYHAIRKAFSAGMNGRFLWIANIAKPDFILAAVLASLTYLMISLGPNVSQQSQRWMLIVPVVITFAVMLRFAAGYGLYWLVSNTVTIVQTAIVRRYYK
ncbi:MAG: YidC/Oxa1 family membrane protein insertase [bacterium]